MACITIWPTDCDLRSTKRNEQDRKIQAELRDRQIPAWLFYDHHHRDAISYRILGLPESLMVSPALVLSDSSRGRAGEAGTQNRALPPRYGSR
jgi:hypothetical protein